MRFTYSDYSQMLTSLRDNGYQFSSYNDNFENTDSSRHVILRHDIDFDPPKALKLAEIENESGVHSTYFVLVTSDLYNPFSCSNREIFKKILNKGHEIGLHYDEMAYPDDVGNANAVRENIIRETALLQDVIGVPVTTFSYHRPSKEILDAQIQIDGLVNSYSEFFFHKFKYLSDSRRRWREPVDDIISNAEYKNLHILTHAFWYNENELNIHDSIKNFVDEGSMNRYVTLADNITDMDSILKEEEIK